MFTALPITAQHTMERGVFDLQKVKFEYALGLFKSPVALISKHIKISFFFLLQLEAVLVKEMLLLLLLHSSELLRPYSFKPHQKLRMIKRSFSFISKSAVCFYKIFNMTSCRSCFLSSERFLLRLKCRASRDQFTQFTNVP